MTEHVNQTFLKFYVFLPMDRFMAHSGLQQSLYFFEQEINRVLVIQKEKSKAKVRLFGKIIPPATKTTTKSLLISPLNEFSFIY